ncbi:MAG: response regulator [Lachnospiraceae bacterium]|nr:response regulator [Lachnospiraceae bacterium]
MDRMRNDQFIITLVSLSCFALTIESIALKWEMWVIPLIFIGTVLVWVLHITERGTANFRENCYLIYALLAIYFHGIHLTSMYDVVVVYCMVIIAFSFLDKIYMMNLFLGECFFLMMVHIIIAVRKGLVTPDFLFVSTEMLHFAVAVAVYYGCVRSIQGRLANAEKEKQKEQEIATIEQDVEDFFSNISHELRTPMNVISGMADLLIRKGVREEALAIKEAGVRLTGQIDDILDYTEARRGNALLEEENYMVASLLHDMVTSFHAMKDKKELELVVDLSPDIPAVLNGDIKKLHKILRQLLANAIAFTKQGGILLKIYAERTNYGVNLHIDISDTGVGMNRKELSSLTKGLYQADKRRDRSTGGIGLGLSIVYGFAHRMGGFVKVLSNPGDGTCVRVTIPQKVVNPAPSLSLNADVKGDVLVYVNSSKFAVPKIRDFYRQMNMNLALGTQVSLYQVENEDEMKRRALDPGVKWFFTGQEEYEANPSFYEELCRKNIMVTVVASGGFTAPAGSGILVIPKPLYSYSVIKVLNEGRDVTDLDFDTRKEKPDLTGIRALIVDDEPMNLVVAQGLFADYGMIVDTAESGAAALSKCAMKEYDIVFMDHMMPEMDGVEAMKRLRRQSEDIGGKRIPIVALTANVVSGARELFMKEGFDGFLGKPVNLHEFEKVMVHLFR